MAEEKSEKEEKKIKIREVKRKIKIVEENKKEESEREDFPKEEDERLEEIVEEDNLVVPFVVDDGNAVEEAPRIVEVNREKRDEEEMSYMVARNYEGRSDERNLSMESRDETYSVNRGYVSDGGNLSIQNPSLMAERKTMDMAEKTVEGRYEISRPEKKDDKKMPLEP